MSIPEKAQDTKPGREYITPLLAAEKFIEPLRVSGAIRREEAVAGYMALTQHVVQAATGHLNLQEASNSITLAQALVTLNKAVDPQKKLTKEQLANATLAFSEEAKALNVFQKTYTAR